MNKGWVGPAALGVVTMVIACAPPPSAHVRWVESSTPGVKYVVVRPGFTAGTQLTKQTQSDGSVVGEDAEYILLCDARGHGPMRCDIPPEVGARLSIGPSADSGPVVDVGVGVLGTKIAIQHEGSPVSSSTPVNKATPPAPDATAAPPPATAAAPPPPPPPPPPPTTDKPPTGKEKKK